MRTFLAIVVAVLGAAIGLMSAASDDTGVRVVMIAVGLLFAAPIALVIARSRILSRRGMAQPEGPISDGTSVRDLAANYWRDKGHAPFAKPPDARPDENQFDPDKGG